MAYAFDEGVLLISFYFSPCCFSVSAANTTCSTAKEQQPTLNAYCFFHYCKTIRSRVFIAPSVKPHKIVLCTKEHISGNSV